MEEQQYPYVEKESMEESKEESKEGKIKPKDIIVNIDFEQAKTEWRKNKINIGEGVFKYACKYVHSSGKICGKPVYSYFNNKKYNYNFGGASDSMNNSSNMDEPKVKKACKRHINRVY